MSIIQMHVELKGLQTRLERAKAEYNEAERDFAALKSKHERELVLQQAKLTHTKEQVVRHEEELKKFQERNQARNRGHNDEAQNIVVSEHALLRYLERVKGIDMDEIRREILQPDVVHAIQHFRGGLIPANGFRLRVRDKTVTTIMVDDDED